MKPPRLSGAALTAARIAAETPGTDAAIREIMKRSLGIDQLGALPEAWRDDQPIDARPLQAAEARRWGNAGLGALPVRAWPRPTSGVRGRVSRGRVTPRQVAERALRGLDALAERRPSMNITIARDAEATLRDADSASARFQPGTHSIGPLDGVPFLVKDGVRRARPADDARLALLARDARRARRDGGGAPPPQRGGVPRQDGAHRVGHVADRRQREPGDAAQRAPRRARARQLVHGLGSGRGHGPRADRHGGRRRGIDPHPRGAQRRLRHQADLRPGELRRRRLEGSVAHCGPIACSTNDLALFLTAVAAEHDADDALTAWAPPPPPGGFGAMLGASVRGLRIGVDQDEWRDASDPVARACREALRGLEREGAILVEVRMPLARHAARIGYLTIGPESLTAHRREWLEQRELITEDVRLVFAVLSGISAVEQLDAQRLRAGLRREVRNVLRGVDVLAMPTTAITAPRYTESDAKTSFSDPAALDGVCRYAFLANLTGLPAGTAPIGTDTEGLPIGLQIMGDAWDEAAVLGVLAHLERSEIARVPRPTGAIDLLEG